MRHPEVLAACGAALTVGIIACSSPSTPQRLSLPFVPPDLPPPTVFVTNPTCSGGVCQQIWVSVFSLAFMLVEPEDPAGLALLDPNGGEVDGPAACLTFMPADTGHDTYVVSAGKIDSVPVDWRPDDPAGLFLEVWPLGANTKTFNAGDSPGWDLTIAADTASNGVSYTAQVSPDTACVPSS